MKLIKSLSLFVLILTSCERVFDIELPHEADEYILYAELPTNSPVKVFLSKSSSINEVLDFNVDSEDVTVILYEYEQALEVLEWKSEGYYESRQAAFSTAGKYKVKVFDNDNVVILETHYASPMVLTDQIEIIRTKELIEGINWDLETERYEVVVPETQEISFYSFNSKGIVRGAPLRLSDFFIGIDSEIKSDCNFSLPSTLFFSSKCSNGLEQMHPMGVELSTFDPITQNMVKPEKVVISVRQMDEDWFDYYQTISDPNLFENVFAQPLIFDSNFTKGRGVWAAANTYKETFDLE